MSGNVLKNSHIPDRNLCLCREYVFAQMWLYISVTNKLCSRAWQDRARWPTFDKLSYFKFFHTQYFWTRAGGACVVQELVAPAL